MKPRIISGEIHTDFRGTLEFFNRFDMSEIRRFYSIKHNDRTVRAWQAHREEQKWFHCIEGEFEVILVKLDDFQSPADNLEKSLFKLTSKKPEILHIPGGYANGFVNTHKNSRMMIYSDFDLDSSEKDGLKFDQKKWHQW